MPYTLTLPFTVEVPVGPATLYDAVREARNDARRDAAEARAEERREMAGPCWPSAAMEG